MSRALARAGSRRSPAVVLPVLLAGVVAAGPQQSSGAPNPATASVMDYGPSHGQVSRTSGAAAIGAVQPVLTSAETPAAGPVRPPALAARPLAQSVKPAARPQPVRQPKVADGLGGVRMELPVAPIQPVTPAPKPIKPPARVARAPSSSLPTTYPAGSTGLDISMYQCADIPAVHAAVAVVQVSGGTLNGPPNPCYVQEAAWAGTQLSAYIYLNGLPVPLPPESMSGPAYRCAPVNPACQGYDFGFNWASHWLAYSQQRGIDPKLWWLDVENGSGWTSLAANEGVIGGAAEGLRSHGVQIGIYSTPSQWATIAGPLTFPGVPVWTAGAGQLSGPGFTATTTCSTAGYSFAGGHLTMVQWGYTGAFPGAYPVPTPYDYDYVCKRG